MRLLPRISEAVQDRLEQQLIDHQPVDGRCPLCGSKLCAPRLNAHLLLTAAGFDLDLSDDDRVILALWRQYREHRNSHLGICFVDLVADCDLALAAWEGLLELGLHPATVAS